MTRGDEQLRELERLAQQGGPLDRERFYTALLRKGVDLRPLNIRIDHDPDTESPLEYDGWKLHVLHNLRRWSHVDPESVGFVYNDVKGTYAPNIGLRKKLKVGLAFWVDYYEHGLCSWGLAGGTMDRWDTSPGAAILVWEQPSKNLGPKTYEAREKDAANTLETYTMWCNGNTYYYDIEVGHSEDEDDIGEDIGSCGGYIGEDSVLEGIKESIGTYWQYVPVHFVGGCAFVGDDWRGRTWNPSDYGDEG